MLIFGSGTGFLIFYDVLSSQLEVVNLSLINVRHYFKVQDQFLHPHVPKFRTNEMFKVSKCISAKHNKDR